MIQEKIQIIKKARLSKQELLFIEFMSSLTQSELNINNNIIRWCKNDKMYIKLINNDDMYIDTYLWFDILDLHYELFTININEFIQCMFKKYYNINIFNFTAPLYLNHFNGKYEYRTTIDKIHFINNNRLIS